MLNALRKSVGFLVVAGLLAVGCATTGPQQFGRYKGRALKLDVAIYQGIPPEQYAYRKIGDGSIFLATHLVLDAVCLVLTS